MIRRVPTCFDAFPTAFSDLRSVQQLYHFQAEHFQKTYEHFGLSSVALPGFCVLAWDVSAESLVNVGIATREATWDLIVVKTTEIYQAHTSFRDSQGISVPNYRPKIYFLFDHEQFRRAVSSCTTGPGGKLFFLDSYKQDYASNLSAADVHGYNKYMGIFGFARHNGRTYD